MCSDISIMAYLVSFVIVTFFFLVSRPKLSKIVRIVKIVNRVKFIEIVKDINIARIAKLPYLKSEL